MKRMVLVVILLTVVGLSGCAQSLLRTGGLPEIREEEYVNNPEARPASNLVLYNSWLGTHAWVYLYRGDRRDEEIYANVNGKPKIFQGKYIKKVFLTNCINKNFPVKESFALDVDQAYTVLIAIEHGAFGKFLPLQKYVISTNRGMFTAQYVDPTGFRSQWANNVIPVNGSDAPAYPGPFFGTFTVSPSQIIFGR